MKYGVMLECIPSNSFELFQCSYKKVRREFLDQEELDLLYKKEFTVKRDQVGEQAEVVSSSWGLSDATPDL